MSPRRDTVLFVSAFPYLGGAQVSLASVVSSLPDGIHAAIAVPAEGPLVDRMFSQRPEAEHVVIPQVGRGGGAARSRVRIVVALTRWVVTHRRSLLAIHANGDSELKFVVPLMVFLRVPIIVWYHRAQITDTTTRLRPLWALLQRRLVWVAVSETRADELRGHRIGSPKNLIVVPNPIDRDEVVPTTRSAHEGFVVGYLGCEYESKGFLVLPAIARAINGSGARILCVVKGVDPGYNTRAVNAALDELGQLPEVQLRPRTFDVREIFAEIDAVVVPSQAESFCRIAAEAMMNGLPVVGSDLPALRELIGTEAGVLFPTGDAAAAASAILRLATDHETASRLGGEGMRRAERFDPARIAGELVALYRTPLPVDLERS